MNENQALALYHAHYDNAHYQALQVTMVTDLCGAYQAHEPRLLERALATPPIHALLNLVTDTALEACGHPLMVGRRERLLRALVDSGATATSLCAIDEYLEDFEQHGDAFSATFYNTGLALLQLRAADLYAPKSQTSAIRSREGRIAHALIAAAEHLLTLARLVLLREPSAVYRAEKLRAAERYLADAKSEML